MLRFLILIPTFVVLLMLGACGKKSNGTSDFDGPASEHIEPELDFVPGEVTLEPNMSSRVLVRGMIGGDTIEMDWDFLKVGDSDVTNGGIIVMPSQHLYAVGLKFDAQWAGMQGTDDYDVMLILGNVTETAKYYNGQKKVTEPEYPYANIKVQKGPDSAGNDAYRHALYDEGNLLCVRITKFVYSDIDFTAHVVGGMKSTWPNGDFVSYDFDVLIGGPHDRFQIENQNALFHGLSEGLGLLGGPEYDLAP